VSEPGATRVTLTGDLAIEHAGARATADDALPAQARIVFVVLVLERHRALSRDELADAIWGDAPPATWESALRSLVSRVRAFVVRVGLPESAVTGAGGTYRLTLPDDTVVDVEEAERGAQIETKADAAAEVLGRPLLVGVDSPWVDDWRRRLGELRVRALELDASTRLAHGDHTGAAVAAEAAVAAAPFRESAWRLVMQAHAAAGNRAEGLRAYERCRRVLADDLGANPSPETEAVYVTLLGDEPVAATGGIVAVGPPAGTLTFLFTDIEGSAARWEHDAEAMTVALATHDDLLRAAIEGRGGRVFKHTGDGICAVFATAREAVLAAADGQLALHAADWNGPGPLRVRMALHTGEADQRDDDYSGVALNRVSRLCALAHGGQTLVSSSTRLVVDGRLPAPVTLEYLGDVELRGFGSTEGVYELRHPDLPAGFPPVLAGHRQRSRLAPEELPLVGRSRELTMLLDGLATSRLVTLTGVGGVGKTRLALAGAHRVAPLQGGRVWWVELAPVDAGGVAHAAANVVGGVRQGVDAVAASIAALDTGPALLVLDNCEHVAEAVRSLVGALLNGCPDLHVLCTSRTALDIAGEQVLVVSPLPHAAAVEVFLRRASAASHGFTATEANRDAIDEIARRLDGLPLALELAAARVRSMSPVEIAGHLDERFRLLRRTHRDTSGRERNLEDTVRWSHELLSADERALFDALSVFASSFTAEAAAAVAGRDLLDVIDLLDVLVQRSMVVVVDHDVETRFGLLETLREFGQRSLESTAERAGEVAGAHTRYYLDMATDAAVGIQTSGEARWVQVLHADLANVRGAFCRAVEGGDVDTALRIVVSLFDYAFFRLRREVGEWALDAVELPGAADHPLYAPACGAAGYLAWQRGALDDARRLAVLGVDSGGGWIAHDALATIELFQGRVGDAARHYALAGDAAAADANTYLEAIALGQRSFAAVFAAVPGEGTGDEAIDLAATAQEFAFRSGNPTANAHTAWAMGVALFDRDPAGALEELARCIELARDVDNKMSQGAASSPAEELRTKLSRRGAAEDFLAGVEQVEFWVEAGNISTMWGTVRRVARALAALGRYELAAVALGAEAGATLKLPVREREQRRHDAVVAEVTRALGATAFEAAASRGAAMSAESLVAALRDLAASLDT
jgi:predicted ATPase/DNA-binding SARP family transcriptional activator